MISESQMYKLLGMDELSEEELCTRTTRRKARSSAAETDEDVTDGSEQSGQMDTQHDDECTYQNCFRPGNGSPSAMNVVLTVVVLFFFFFFFSLSDFPFPKALSFVSRSL